MKLAIGLLLSNGFPIPAPFFLSYVALIQRLQAGIDNAVLPPALAIESAKLIHSQDFPVDAARNDVIRAFLDTDARYLLFLDCDMTHPPDLPARLVRHDEAVVTARYHMRKAPFHAVALQWEGPNEFDSRPLRDGHHPRRTKTGLIPIDFGGAGALLIRRDVLERMRDRDGENWFRYSRQTRPPYELRISEDMAFYKGAREAGFQPYVDWGLECGHISSVEINGTWNVGYLEQMDKERARREAQRVGEQAV